MDDQEVVFVSHTTHAINLLSALYEPGLGYYAGGSRKFGAAGDFVTAPEMSPLFGQCLAAR